MNANDLQTTLDSLIATWENEVVEFKQAGDGFSTNDIGKYFSALSNEANLRGIEKAWLVFGVNNESRTVVGTGYRPEPERLQSLKMQIAENTAPGVTFRHIHELDVSARRVILFEIPPAPRGMPIAWKGHYYARAGESLTNLGLDKLDSIRQQTLATDWSAQIVANASLGDLDPVAIQRARAAFILKHANRFTPDEVEEWSDSTFLDRAKLTQGGKMTRTAILLLGKPESAYLLSPHPAQMTWKLVGEEQAYEHFSLPFMLNTSLLYQRIRNIQLRLLPFDELLPYEVSKYDQKIVLEALHNCIAHQDYSLYGRIIVTEKNDRLVLENVGSFFEGKPEDYILNEKTPHRYRNPFLVQAMAELNMIDTMGYGIHQMHSKQAERYLPMPDYDVSDTNSVSLTLHGGVVDPAYSQLLMQEEKLTFESVLALDRVQKKLKISDDVIKQLRRDKLIEGRKPNLHVAARIASATSSKADYIRTRSLGDGYYKKLITEYLEKFSKASRKEIDDILYEKLSDVLSDKQKKTKVGHLLTQLRMADIIYNAGSKAAPEWRLTRVK
ncbi:MAG: transcriptional regulator [Gammaproteobacteria bacterium]|nr:transcriptional regulator [Gammaproteobacteria bacterium]